MPRAVFRTVALAKTLVIAISKAKAKTLPTRLICTVAALSCLVVSIGHAAPPQAAIGFLRDHCMDCHEGDSAEAGFDLRKIGTELKHPAVLDNWVKAVDRVRAGEMPPKDAGDVDKKLSTAFTRETGNWIRSYQRREYAALGRVRGRRLTNLQLENTLQDLFAIDVPLAELMPDEQRTDGFTNIAEGQSMSHFQLQNHLVAVDAALDAAFDRAADTEKPFQKTFNAKQLCRKDQERRCREPELLSGKAVVWSGGPIFYGRLPMMTARRSSWYRFTIKASALKPPKDHGVWCSVRSGRCTSGAPLLKWVGAFEATSKPKEMTYEAWIPERHMLEIRPADVTLKKGRFEGGQVGAGEGGPQKVPGLALHSMTVQEIFPAGSVAFVQERLFGKGVKVSVDRKSGKLKVGYKDAAKESARQLRSFARRAFRRDMSEEQLKPYLRLLSTNIANGDSAADALRAAYRAILCSPRFMYFSENAGILDDYAIATRLSYMIYNSTPDWKLLTLAKDGKLRNRETIYQEVERMLKTRRGRDFVTNFTDQWLDMVDISFTEPDRKLHRDFDIVVQESMLSETRTYVQKMLDQNAPVSGLVKSNHTYLNSRLARFYDIDGVTSDKMQRVSLTADSHRGGLLAQGAILKVTANGTNTSPVLRGVWVADRIMGQHIPPPPENVPAIEPDIRGAKTIREMLAKHRSNDACASCHKKIDPNGFALENFDAAGQWRNRYPGSKKSKGKAIDPSFRLPDGRAFKDFAQFRDLVAAKPWPLARNFAEKLLVYGTGAPIAFSDRDELKKIVEQTKDDRFGLRSLLKAVVTSRVFLTK